MAAVAFPDFLKKCQLLLLAVSNADTLPGAVLDKGKRGYMYQGHLKDLLGQEEAFWETELTEAEIAQGSVEREFSLEGRSSFTEMGVEVKGGLRRAKSATVAITGVHALTFAAGAATKFKVMPLVNALRQQDKPKWKMVNGRWLVFETYYASEATVTFATDGNVNLQAEVEAAGGALVQGGGGLAWNGKRSFTITENDKVPFAFRGWQV